MEVRVIDMVSLSSDGKKNEDKVGIKTAKQGGAAWVIDGATGVNNAKHIHDSKTDATWYAEQLNEIFFGLNNGTSIDSMARTAIQKIAAAYENNIDAGSKIPKIELPSAAVLWMQWSKDKLVSSLYHLDLGWLGDCVAIIEYKNEVLVYGNELSGFSNNDITKLLQEVKITAAHSLELQKTLISDAIEQERMKMNKEDGYWIFSTDVKAAENLCKSKLSFNEPATILLATDGLYRLVDLYKRYTPAELIQTCKNRGLHYLANELRDIEQKDVLCEKYPRFKVSDDATALFFKISLE